MRAVVMRRRRDLPSLHRRHGRLEVGRFDQGRFFPEACWWRGTVFGSVEAAHEALKGVEGAEAWRVVGVAAEEEPEEQTLEVEAR